MNDALVERNPDARSTGRLPRVLRQADRAADALTAANEAHAILHLGSFAGRQLKQLFAAALAFAARYPDRLADGDRPRPAERCRRLSQSAQATEDRDQRLLGCVSAVPQRARAAQPRHLGGKDVDQLGHRELIASLRRPNEPRQVRVRLRACSRVGVITLILHGQRSARGRRFLPTRRGIEQ